LATAEKDYCNNPDTKEFYDKYYVNAVEETEKTE